MQRTLILMLTATVAFAADTNLTNAVPTKVIAAVSTNLTLTIDGEKYEDVRFGQATAANVKIFHSSGVATIPLSKLPPELQQRFGYNPEKAADYQSQVEKNRINQYKKTLDLRKIGDVICDFSYLTKLKDFHGKLDNACERRRLERLGINQNASSIPQAVRDEHAKYASISDQELQNRRNKVFFQINPYIIRGRVKRVLKGGVILSCYIYAGGLWVPERADQIADAVDVCLKHIDTHDVVDDSAIEAFAIPVDNFSYLSSTIRAFDCGVPIDAEDYHGKVVVLPIEDKRVIDLP